MGRCAHAMVGTCEDCTPLTLEQAARKWRETAVEANRLHAECDARQQALAEAGHAVEQARSREKIAFTAMVKIAKGDAP